MALRTTPGFFHWLCVCTISQFLVTFVHCLYLPETHKSLHKPDFQERSLLPRQTDGGPWGGVKGFEASQWQKGRRYDVSLTIVSAPGSLKQPSDRRYLISRANALNFIKTAYLQVEAEKAVGSEKDIVPSEWKVSPNNNFRIDLVRETRGIGEDPWFPLTWWLLNQAIAKLYWIMKQKPTDFITDGQIAVLFFLPQESRSGSVTKADGKPCAILAMSRTNDGGAGTGGKPAFISQYAGSGSPRTRGQILFGDKFPGNGDYIELPSEP